mgnify:FL=1
MGIVVRKLIDKIEMLSCIEVIRELYPSLNEEEYMRQLDEMLPHNYFQVGAFKGDECIGISGVWIGNKLWCGKYLEIDHIVVRSGARSEGVGRLLVDFLKQLALEENCASLGLDSFTFNHQSHKFFFKEGFEIKGFHFVNILDESKFNS